MGVLVLFSCNLVLLAALGWPILQRRFSLPEIIPPDVVTLASTVSIRRTATTTTTQTPAPPTPTARPPSQTPTLEATRAASLRQGLMVLGLKTNGQSHLYIYQPLEGQASSAQPLTRLTYGSWDDIDPAVSPDGKRVAFASNRNGYWDLYVLDLLGGEVTRLTDSLEYDGSPAWSPDGLWVVYETYVDENLDIFIRSVDDPQQSPIRLTSSASGDYSPAWSPQWRSASWYRCSRSCSA